MRVGVSADDGGHRFQQVALSRERMQPLDVDQHVRRRQAECAPHLLLSGVVVEAERWRHGRIDDRAAGAIESELARAIVEALTVERHRSGAAVRRGEEIDPELPAVVPDLGSVQREHDRFPETVRDPGGHLGQQAVAVHVNDVGGCEECGGVPPDAQSARDRAGAEQALRQRTARTRHPGDIGARVRWSADGRVRDEMCRISALARPVAEVVGQQRVRSLIGRQMGRDVDDSHGAPDAGCSGVGAGCDVPDAGWWARAAA
jgi:Cu/Zn superoxide dismutase